MLKLTRSYIRYALSVLVDDDRKEYTMVRYRWMLSILILAALVLSNCPFLT
jgi:hypothetical protein